MPLRKSGLLHRLRSLLDPHMREVVQGASITFVIKGTSGVLSFLVNVEVARLLGASGAGLYFLALSLVTISATLSRLGFDQVVLRFVAAGAAVDAWDEVRGVYDKSMKWAIAASVVTAGLAVLFGPWITTHLFSQPTLARPLQLMALAIPFQVVLQLHSQALMGLKRIFFAQVTAIGLRVATLVALPLLAGDFGVTGAVQAYVLASALAAATGVVLWRRAAGPVKHAAGAFSTRVLVETAIPLFAIAGLRLVMEWTSTLVLGAAGTAAEVGIFNAAQRTAIIVTLVLTAVNSIAAPKFSELFTLGDREDLGRTARNSTRLMIALAAPPVLILIFFPGVVMGLFGPEFVAGTNVLRVLAVGQFISVAAGSVGFLLIMTGEQRAYRNATTLATIANVGLNVLLVPRWGAMGAAVATSAGLVVVNVGAGVAVWRRLRIRPVPLALWE